jgi:predicted enzyme related to lactoylglutathione lyase
MKLGRVIETCLYVDDLDRAATFYERVLGLTAMTGPTMSAANGGMSKVHATLDQLAPGTRNPRCQFESVLTVGPPRR